MSTQLVEQRFTPTSMGTRARLMPVDQRDTSKGRLVAGYAALYHDGTPRTEYELAPGVTERIARGAFDRSLRERPDVVIAMNHDLNLILGRSGSGTARIVSDAVGLRFVVALPDTSAGRDVAELLRRGDLSGCSFSFVVVKDKWSMQNGKRVRDLIDVDLLEAGPVVLPAYKNTNINFAAGGDRQSDRDSIIAVLKKINRDAMRDRVRQIEDIERNARARTQRDIRLRAIEVTQHAAIGGN